MIHSFVWHESFIYDKSFAIAGMQGLFVVF